MACHTCPVSRKAAQGWEYMGRTCRVNCPIRLMMYHSTLSSTALAATCRQKGLALSGGTHTEGERMPLDRKARGQTVTLRRLQQRGG